MTGLEKAACRGGWNRRRYVSGPPELEVVVSHLAIHWDLDLQLGEMSGPYLEIQNKEILEPWLEWLSGLSTGLRTKGSLIGFPVRAHAWVSGQVPGSGHARGNHTVMFLSLSFSLLSPL